MKLIGTILIAALMVACSSSAPSGDGIAPPQIGVGVIESNQEVWINPAWAPTHYHTECEGICPDAVVVAVDAWNDIYMDTFFDDGEASRPIWVVIVTPEEMRAMHPQGLDGGLAIYVEATEDSPSGCGVFVSTNFDDSPQVYAHEFGHCIGLGHSSDPNSIMAPNGGTYFTTGIQEILEENYPHD